MKESVKPERTGASVPRPATIVGLILALVLPVIVSAVRQSPVQLTARRVLFSIANDWVVAVALLLLVLIWEGRPLRSIGLKAPKWSDLGWGFGGFIVGVIAFGLVGPIVIKYGLGSTLEGISTLASLPLYVTILIALTAGVTEELLFRGYAIERLSEISGSTTIGACAAYVIFVGLHAPFWGIGGTLQIGVWSLLITWIYVRRRTLVPCIVMHVLNDLFAFVLMPILMTRSGH